MGGRERDEPEAAGDAAHAAHHDPERSEEEVRGVRRESVTMALYVSITLTAGLVFAENGWEERKIVGLVWGTTIGLAVAHWLAFALANRLVDPDRDHGAVTRELRAQVGGAAAVAGIVSAAVWVAPDDHKRLAAQIAVVLLVGVIVVRLSRSYGASWGRSLRGAAIAVLLALVVASFKESLLD